MVAIARLAPQPARVPINIRCAGILSDGDTMDLGLADVEAAKDAMALNRDSVIGVTARLTRGVAADDVEVLRRAQEVATSFDLPLIPPDLAHAAFPEEVGDVVVADRGARAEGHELLGTVAEPFYAHAVDGSTQHPRTGLQPPDLHSMERAGQKRKSRFTLTTSPRLRSSENRSGRSGSVFCSSV